MLDQTEFIQNGIGASLVVFLFLGIYLLLKKKVIQSAINNITDSSFGNIGFYFIFFIYFYGVLSTYESFLIRVNPTESDGYSGIGNFVYGFFMQGIYPFLNSAFYLVQVGSVILAAIILHKYLKQKEEK